MTFADALAFTLTWEGGHVDHPSDPGGETKYGISKRSYPDEDIAALTINDAARIYRQDFWNELRCDDMPPGVALAVFDYAVNSGVPVAARALQNVLYVNPDGKIGDKTIAALKPMRPAYVVEGIMFARAEKLITLVRNASTYRPFIKGWTRRLMAVAVKAGELCHA